MTPNTPLFPLPPGRLADAVQQRVMTAWELRRHGVSALAADGCCRPGGPWQLLLPGVYVLHAGPLTGEERLHGALLYATGPAAGADSPDPAAGSPLPWQPGPAPRHETRAGAAAASSAPRAMVTGRAALALHRFACVEPLDALDRIDVLVPRALRLRSTGCVRLVRDTGGRLPYPEPVQVRGQPVAPVPRALADAVGRMADAVAVRRLLVESVRGGYCEPVAVVRELVRAGLLGRPHVADAVEALLAEGRAQAEGLLRDTVLRFSLPHPFWNVELALPGGPRLGAVDAYWPEPAVAVELDCRASWSGQEAHGPDGPGACAYGPGLARKRETLERFGITLVRLAPGRLRSSPSAQAAIVRTALVTAGERQGAEPVVVLPR